MASPPPPPLPGDDERPTDERNLRESLGAIVPGSLVALGVGLLVLVVRQIFGFPGWLGLLIFGFAASVPLSDLVTIVFLRRALNKKP